jgi:hypothetical protein
MNINKKTVPQTAAVSVSILMMMMMIMMVVVVVVVMIMMTMVTEHASKTLFFKLTLTELIIHKSKLYFKLLL